MVIISGGPSPSWSHCDVVMISIPICCYFSRIKQIKQNENKKNTSLSASAISTQSRIVGKPINTIIQDNKSLVSFAAVDWCRHATLPLPIVTTSNNGCEGDWDRTVDKSG